MYICSALQLSLSLDGGHRQPKQLFLLWNILGAQGTLTCIQSLAAKQTNGGPYRIRSFLHIVMCLRRPLLPKEPAQRTAKPNRTRRPKPSEAKAKAAAGKSKAKAKAKALATPGEEADAEVGEDEARRAAKRPKK